MNASAAQAAPRGWRSPSELPLAVLAALSIAAAFVLRAQAGRDIDLTLDEIFTAIATGIPGWTEFWRSSRQDVTAPLYYVLMWLLPGDSNFALRLPSWLLMIGAAALPLLWRVPGQSRPSAITWAALLYLWLPGAVFALQARPYALLFLAGTAQTIAFARLVDQPTLRRAFVWTAWASVSILTHYMSAALGLAQGLVLLFVLRRHALRLWPALLVLLIPAVEAVDHLRILAGFAASSANWVPPITLDNLLHYVTFGIGAVAGPVLLMVALGGRVLDRREPVSKPAVAAAAAGVIATLILIAAGWGRSLVYDRYMTACAPALMLGLVTVAAGWWSRLLIVAISGAVAAFAAVTVLRDLNEPSFGWAAERLAETRPKQVVFSLGYPGQETLSPGLSAKAGEFIFRRRGLDTEARLVNTLDGRELVRAAGRDSAILWIFGPDNQATAEAIARSRPCFLGRMQLGCPALDQRP